MENNLANKEKQYQKAEKDLQIFFASKGSKHKLSFSTKMALVTAAIKNAVPDFGFVGFYVVAPLLDENGNPTEEKVIELGPYQAENLVAPIIEYGRGVCGDCWKEKAIQVVNDVASCKNYIACDDITKSEIVLPVFQNKDDKENVTAVLDIDSTLLNRFDDSDSVALQRILNFIYL